MRKAKRILAALAAVTMVFGGVNITSNAEEKGVDSKAILTAEKSNSRTARITVIDEETGELFDKDMTFTLIGGMSAPSGAAGAICVGSWDSSEENPYVFEDLPEGFSFFVQNVDMTCSEKVTHDGVEYDGYTYEVDDEKSERSFEVTDGVQKDVKIYIKKYYWKYNKKDESNAAVAPTLKGDADLNGTVDLADLTTIAKYNLSNSSYPLKNETAFANADINNDGKVDGLDVSALIESQLGKEYVTSAQTDKTVELTADLKPLSIQSAKPSAKFEDSQMDFAVSFLKESMKTNSNTLVSPYSAAQALAMVANGAGNNTLKEIMDVMGGGMSINEFNESMTGFNNDLTNDEKCRLLTANSIWYRNDNSFAADKNFLLKNKSCYDAQIFAAPMDQSTVNDVNSWVSEHTDGMIPKITNSFDPATVMALINAVTFDAEWLYPYYGSAKAEKYFTAADGSKQDAEVLSKDTTDSNAYFEDDEAKGFMQYYKGGKYAFAAILPNEGISADKYVEGLTGKKLSALLGSAHHGTRMKTSMPKFTIDCDNNLNDVLMDMGIKEAFNDSADFSKMGRSELGNLCIGDALQKTHIEVDENGTKAAAATFDEIIPVCYIEPKEVILNRPFVYAIVDTQTNIPIFMGILNTLK